jgi:hypothetical protein
MFIEIVLNILFYDNRKLFDCNGDHTLETCAIDIMDARVCAAMT